jgi:hypothetical protein
MAVGLQRSNQNPSQKNRNLLSVNLSLRKSKRRLKRRNSVLW